MKTHLLSILIIISFIGYSQNWNVFNKGYRYNYKYNNSQLVSHVLFTDSVEQTGADTTYYLNRIGVVTGNTLHVNRPQFLMKKLIKLSNGDVNLQDTLNMLIIPTCSVSQTWMFGTNANLSATCVAISTVNIFNSIDSLRTIVLDNNDSILLSKQYGIIQFPHLLVPNTYFKLAGIEKAKRYDSVALFGEKVPNAWDIYDFEINSEFCEQLSYKSGNPSCDNDHCYKRMMTILSKTVTPTGYIYNIGMNHIVSGLSYTWCSFTSHPYSYVNIDLTFDNLDTCSRLENMIYPGMVTTLSFMYNICRYATQGANSNFCKMVGEVYNNSFSFMIPQISNVSKAYDYVSPTTFTTTSDSTLNSARLYAKGFGMTFDLLSYSGYEQITSSGCNIFLGESANIGSKIDRLAFPNPANSKLYFSVDWSQIKFYNSFGKLIRQDVYENSRMVDVSNLQDGLYLIEIQSDSFKSTQKLIIQH